MRYDASLAALFDPQSRASLFTSDRRWPDDALCAECSRLAYLPFEVEAGRKAALGESIACAGLRDPEYYSDASTGTQAYAAIDPERRRAFIVFRGTQPRDLADIGTDAKAILVPWQGAGQVHLGFRDALDGVWDPITSWCGNHGMHETWVTGHSLGAALASLAAARLPGSRLVNFGSPRVGNETFASSFADREVRRYVHCCDLAARLPPLLLGYRHLPGLVYIDRAGQLHRDASEPMMAEDIAIARSEYLLRDAWRLGNAPMRDLADHAPLNYVTALLDGEGAL